MFSISMALKGQFHTMNTCNDNLQCRLPHDFGRCYKTLQLVTTIRQSGTCYKAAYKPPPYGLCTLLQAGLCDRSPCQFSSKSLVGSISLDLSAAARHDMISPYGPFSMLFLAFPCTQLLSFFPKAKRLKIHSNSSSFAISLTVWFICFQV